MKKSIITVLAILLTHPGFALLSPLNQSLEEIQTILQNAELQKHFPQEQGLINIQHTANGYLLKTAKLQMLVDIQYIPIERPGRQQFKLVFHPPTSLVREIKR
jgi:hypothetical protein